MDTLTRDIREFIQANHDAVRDALTQLHEFGVNTVVITTGDGKEYELRKVHPDRNDYTIEMRRGGE